MESSTNFERKKLRTFLSQILLVCLWTPRSECHLTMFFGSGIEGQNVVFLVLAELYLSIDKGLSKHHTTVSKLQPRRDVATYWLNRPQGRTAQPNQPNLDILADPSPILMPTSIPPCRTCVLGLFMCYRCWITDVPYMPSIQLWMFLLCPKSPF